MSLPPGEPPAGPWQVRFLSSLIRALLGVADTQPGRPCVLAIDGRGGSGKTTIAERIRAAVPGAAAVHTDDVAWNHSFFD